MSLLPYTQDGAALTPGAQAPADAWYAVHTRSNFEKRVLSEVSARQIEAYLPVFKAVHRWKDRNKCVETPVFSSYVFVRFPDCDSTRLRILRTPGVVRILGNNGRLEPIPDSQIEAVRRMVQDSRSCFIHPLLREGMRVRVIRGALKGVEGLFVRAKSSCRLVITLPLLSQSIASEIDAADVEPLPDAHRLP